MARLARHFKVSPDWSAIEATGDGSEDNASRGLILKPPYEVVQVGETGHEIRDCDGQVFAWAADRAKALVLAGLLEGAARG